MCSSDLLIAPRLFRVLNRIREAIRQGERNFLQLEREAVAELDRHHWQTDYVAIRRQEDLQAPRNAGEGSLVVLAASRLGVARLIDNLEIDVASAR